MHELLKGLNDPRVKEKVIKLAKKFEPASSFVGHGIDEALFSLPSKNKGVREMLEGLEERNPTSSALGRAAGLFVPAGAALKGASMIPKLAKILRKGHLGASALRGSIAAGVPTAVESVVKDDQNAGAKSLGAAAQGAIVGGVLDVGANALKKAGVVSKIARALSKNKMKTKRAQVSERLDKTGRQLFSELNSADKAKLKNIVANPIKSDVLDVNNFIYRGTPNMQAHMDVLHMLSPKVRAVIKAKKDALSDKHLPFIEEAVIKAGGLSRRPDTAKLVEIAKKRADAATGPLYERAMKTPGAISLSRRTEGDPNFKRAISKQMAKLNTEDVGKAGFEKHSLRNLHGAKKQIGQMEAVAKQRGRVEDERELGQSYNRLKEQLNKASPAYDEATRQYKQKYFDIKDAAQEGKQFRSEKSAEDIIKKLAKYGLGQKHAYKVGALDRLLDESKGLAQKSELGQIGRYIVNPENKKLLSKVLPQEKLAELTERVDTAKKGLERLNSISAGSKTAEHLVNVGGVAPGTVARAAGGNMAGVLKVVGNLIRKKQFANLEGKAALDRMKFLLRPEKLAKVGKKKAYKPAKLPAIVSGSLTRDNTNAQY
jgi:hypothetical protein